jgi:uncharacterized SAM-binding protein YcdF (DUF218 family)
MCKRKRNYDCIIVLGGGVNKNGTCPRVVEKRLDLALKLYNKELSNKILLSGNVGKINVNKKIPEAEAMKNYLLKKGFLKEKIILEDKSTTTFENAYYSRKIIDENKYNKIILITNTFHMKRAKKIFKFFFGKNYKFLFKSADEGNVNKKLLKKRMVFEKALLKLMKKELFNKNKKGDSEEIMNFVRTSKEFNKKIDDLDLEFKDYKNFY